ncbi:hypothetical protein BJ170DRAFT_732100 [Xylariales sp. AK1849]|nr:hypothetical protein BJ170DRAFT_732100 [Xylariales sp. AK1849]
MSRQQQQPSAKKTQQPPKTDSVKSKKPDPSFTPCFHCPENSDYYIAKQLPPLQKKNCKTPANEKVPTAVGHCEICAAYGLQAGWQAGWRSAMGKTSMLHGNDKAISEDEIARGQAQLPTNFKWKDLADTKEAPGPFNFALDKNQFGETFHLLISAILSPSKIRIGLETASDQQKELLHFYFNSNTAADVLKPDPKLNNGSKASATETISYVFERNRNQARVFRYIRDFMDMGRLVHEPPKNKYACPSYCGKYWINRYLLATQKKKLPKSAAVDRIAVINIRRTPETKSKDAKPLQARMEMTKDNLLNTLQGIIAANRVAQLDKPSANLFSHIILYGDLYPEDAEEVDGKVKKWLQKMKNPGMAIEILYITSPWRVLEPATSGRPNVIHSVINTTWANFKGEKDSFLGGKDGGDIDGIPYQVKVISIYLALQARYGNKLCYIGARSGFLETAAFLGSPVFYYNETNFLDFGDKQRYDDGTVLWDGPRTRALYKNDRMGRAVDALNTLVCIDLTKVVQNAKTKGKEVFVEEQGKRQLMAALYMFMLAHTPSREPGPMWEHRVAMRFGDQEAGDFLKAKWDRCATLWISGEQGNKENVSKDILDLLKL